MNVEKQVPMKRSWVTISSTRIARTSTNVARPLPRITWPLIRTAQPLTCPAWPLTNVGLPLTRTAPHDHDHWHVFNQMNWICIIIIIIIIINIIIIIINKHIFIVLYPKRESLDFIFVFFLNAFSILEIFYKTFNRSPVFEKENTAAWNLHITVRLPWVSSFHQFSFHSHFRLTFWFWMMYL